MRKVIIDTDTGSDDAVAIIMALQSKDVEVLAITTVAGNCDLDKATLNCLQTIEIVDAYYPEVHKGSSKPLFRELVTAENVHGEDGMGDQDLVHPTFKHTGEDAVSKIISLIKRYPNEVELVTIGPLTNIAKAILLDPNTMKQTKHIYSMGTQGLGSGNCSPVSEFNVYVDAESYKIVLESNIPITIIGFDICLGDAALHEKDINDLLNQGSPIAEFAVKCNKTLLEYNLKHSKKVFIDLPDPVAMGVFLWDDIIINKISCHAKVIINQDETYGQVIFYHNQHLVLSEAYQNLPKNVTLITKIDSELFKRKLKEILVI
jgi:purine nucleosidase